MVYAENARAAKFSQVGYAKKSVYAEKYE